MLSNAGQHHLNKATIKKSKTNRGNLHTDWIIYIQFSSVQFSRSVVSDTLQPRGLQHTRPPCPSPTAGVFSNSCH